MELPDCVSAKSRAFSCSNSATRLCKKKGRSGSNLENGYSKTTYTSMHSNSSRFRCLLRKAAARFFTKRASRLLRPETSGGMKSLLLIRSPTERCFFVTLGAGLAERLEDEEVVEGAMEMDKRSCLGDDSAGEGGESGWVASGKSKTWCVGRQSCSESAAESGVMRILSILEVGMGESLLEPTELGGEGGI